MLSRLLFVFTVCYSERRTGRYRVKLKSTLYHISGAIKRLSEAVTIQRRFNAFILHRIKYTIQYVLSLEQKGIISPLRHH